MKESLRQKIQAICEKHTELSHSLSQPDVIAQQDIFRQYSRQFSELDPIAKVYYQFSDLEEQLVQTRAMADDSDPDIREMAELEVHELERQLETLNDDLCVLLLPKDEQDSCNVFLEIRAGTGGDEAALFVGDLFRMYQRYCEQKSWLLEVVNSQEGEHGGYREIICKIEGKNVYAGLKFESGTHRVQRVPETESQGRIHTSACTVAVLPEMEVEAIEISREDLRVDTFRSSGAGGQHVNTTDSAIRITHLPTGVVVECQDERSQHKNRARAMSLLNARIVDMQARKQKSEQDQARKLQVGSGDRSERVRTYNFPQARVTDHRVNLTLYRLQEVLMGSLDLILETLIREHQAEQMAMIESSD